MKEYDAKTICTSLIWIATARILIFGVFKMDWTGETAGGLWMVVAVALAIAAAQATRAVWKSPVPPAEPKTPPNETKI